MIGVVALIKNEADILPLWLKALARWAEVVVLMDHGSTDGSSKLLQQVATLSPKWTYLPQSRKGYFQADFTAQGAAIAFGQGAKWVLPLDADEFLRSPKDLGAALGGLRPWEAPSFSWRNAVPKDIPTVYLAPQVGHVAKVALSREMWDAGHRWAEGNCVVHNRPTKVVGELVHLPIRSLEQALLKRRQMNEALVLAGRKPRVFGKGNLLAQAASYPIPSSLHLAEAALAAWPLMDLSI